MPRSAQRVTTRSPERSTAQLTMALLALVALGAALWALAPGPADRGVAVLAVLAVGAGLIATVGREPGTSALPPVLQGLIAGATVGAVVAAGATGAAGWTHLWVLVVLPSLHPALLPQRWRRHVTAGGRDLLTDEARGH